MSDLRTLFRNLSGANFGTLSPQEDADREPSPVGKAVAGMAREAVALPRKVIEASENRRLGGDYDPGPALETAFNLVGTGLPFAAKGAAGVFGGRLAKGADAAALKRAEEMAASGADRGSVWADTGWFKGNDGNWKFEIPDDAMQIKPNIDWGDLSKIAGYRKAQPLEAVIDHPELFKNYPDARSIQVRHTNDPYTGASYTEKPPSDFMGDETIALNMADPNARSALLHEIQHGLQHREGFATGGSPGATNFEGGGGAFGAGLANPIDNVPAVMAAEQRALEAYEKMRPSSLDELKKRTPQQQAAIEAEFGPVYEAAQREANQARWSSYQTLPGEVEARNVQERSMFGHNSRRGIAPWESEK